MAEEKDSQDYHLISRWSKGSQEVRGHFGGPTGTAGNHQRSAEPLAADMAKASISLKTELLLFGEEQEVCWLVAKGKKQNQVIM